MQDADPQKTNELVLIVGKKGSGKTFLARAIAATVHRLVVLDPKCCFGGAPVATGADAAEWLREAIARPDFGIIVRPRNEADEDAFWRIWLDPPAGFMRDCTLIVDEVDRWCTPNNARPELLHLVHYGRHQCVDLVCTCRRASNVGPTMRSQADNIIAFRTDEPVDLEQLGKWMDVSRLPTLPMGCYIEREPNKLTEGL